MVPVFLAFYLRATGLVADRIERRSDRGQGTLEYVGMVAVAALVIVAVVTAIKGANLGEVVGGAITKVTSAVSG